MDRTFKQQSLVELFHPLQACRTEAEYAFQQRKKIIPIIMESGFKPSGWLGALMGTRLYFDMSEITKISSKSLALVKGLGSMGK